MKSEELGTVILSADKDSSALKSVVTRLEQHNFKVIIRSDLREAISEGNQFSRCAIVHICKALTSSLYSSLIGLQPQQNIKIAVYEEQASRSNSVKSTSSFQFDFLAHNKDDPRHSRLIQWVNHVVHVENSQNTKAFDILSAMSDGVVSINNDNRIVYLNPTACRLAGILAKEASDQKVEDTFDLRDPVSNKKVTQQIFEEYQNSVSTNEDSSQSRYLLLNSKHNKQYKIALRSNTFYTSQNGIERIVVLRDITNKPNISHRFPAPDNKYWALVNTTKLGYCILDKQGSVVDANDEFLRITGRDNLEDIIGVDALQWVASDDTEKVFRSLEQLLKTGKIVGMEVNFQASDGNVTPIEFNATVIKENDDYHLLGIGRDISERKEAEREKELIQTQLRQAQKMEAIGQLTGGIAHDFNNVLASILGYTELSQNLINQSNLNPYHRPVEINHKFEDYLEAIHDASTRARDLIQQLMVFSRSGEISPQYMKVEPAIHEIVKLLSSTLPKTLNIGMSFEDNLPLLHIDPIQLHQVIMNLCINSRDALNEIGEIKISVQHRKKCQRKACASCHSIIDGDFIDITVKDNGPGIPKQHKERVFEPFYTTKTIGQGTGMGLSMVHGIVHEHGGHILLETSPQTGTATHLLFPIKTPEISRNTALPSLSDQNARATTTGANIVVIEDEKSLAKFLNDLFSSHGYKVTTYTDSLVARTELPEKLEEIDVIITDHTMPGITGTQLSKELLEIRPDLPIILCTGFSFQVNEKTALDIGIQRFLKKPISSTQLLKEVEYLTQQSVLI